MFAYYNSIACVQPYMALYNFTQFAGGSANFAPLGLSFTRGNDASVQTGDNTLILSVGINSPRVGRLLSSDPMAWVCEGALSNSCSTPFDLSSVNWNHDGATVVTHPSGELGPDGTAIGTYLDSGADSSAGASTAAAFAPFAAGGMGFVWVKRKAGTGQDTGDSQVMIATDAKTVGSASLITVGQTWVKQVLTLAPANQTYRLWISDNEDRTSLGGGNPGATKNIYVCPQLHTGQFNQEFVNGTRSTDRLFHPSIEKLIDSSTLAFHTIFQPKGGHTQFGVATGILWWHSATNLCEWDRTTSSIRLVINGTTYLTAGTMAWAQRDIVELVVAVRAGQAAYAAYRVNNVAGVRLSSGSPPTLTMPAITGEVDFWCGRTSGAGGTVGRPLAAWVRQIGFLKANILPAWAP